MKKIKLLATFLEHKYNLNKFAIDANNIRDSVASTLQTALANASTQPGLGIMPFMRMLEADNASLSLSVYRSDSFTGPTIKVDNLQVNPPELQSKYAALAQQAQAYFNKYDELFPSKNNGESIDYKNFSVTLVFGAATNNPVAAT